MNNHINRPPGSIISSLYPTAPRGLVAMGYRIRRPGGLKDLFYACNPVHETFKHTLAQISHPGGLKDLFYACNPVHETFKHILTQISRPGGLKDLFYAR